jgi:hypothetical protein
LDFRCDRDRGFLLGVAYEIFSWWGREEKEGKGGEGGGRGFLLFGYLG